MNRKLESKSNLASSDQFRASSRQMPEETSRTRTSWMFTRERPGESIHTGVGPSSEWTSRAYEQRLSQPVEMDLPTFDWYLLTNLTGEMKSPIHKFRNFAIRQERHLNGESGKTVQRPPAGPAAVKGAV